MPFKIVKQNDKWIVKSPNRQWTHDSEQSAKEQLKALYANVKTESVDNKQLIREYLDNHNIYKDLNEIQKYSLTEIINKNHKDLKLLDEYVDMYMLPTAGWGMNSNDNINYNNPSMGASSGGTTYGYGGVGTGTLGGQSRQGTRVYGYGPNNMSPGDGYAPFGDDPDNGDPAVVIVSPDKDVYKPWETELTSDLEHKKSEIDRNKVISKKEDAWNSPLGEVLRTLEDYGYDAADVLEMSQEDIQNIIIKVLKKEKQESQTETLAEHIKYCDSLTEKINEAFMTEDELMEKWKRYSKIQIARELLAYKHHQRKAVEKFPNSKKYLLDQYNIEKMMKQYGYIYDDQNKKWLKSDSPLAPDDDKSKKSSDDSEPSSIPIHAVDKDKKDQEKHSMPYFTKSNDEQPSLDSQDDINSPVPSIDGEREFTISFSDKVKDAQGRIILSLGYDDLNATKYIPDENLHYIPFMKPEDVLTRMENLQYEWNGDKNAWINTTNISYPENIYEKNETKKSIIARSYSIALGNIDSIFMNEDYTFMKPIETIYEDLAKLGYVYNEELGKWYRVEENITESAIIEAQQNPNNPKNFKNKNDNIKDYIKLYGYNNTQVLEKTARLCLYYIYYKKMQDNKQNPAFKSELDDPNTHPLKNMPVNRIEKELKANKYSVEHENYMEYWTDTPNVPSIVHQLSDDTLDTYVGRAILSIINKSPKYLMLDFDGKTIEPQITKDSIKKELKSHNYKYSPRLGWKKEQEIDADEDFGGEDLSPEEEEMLRGEKDILNRYENADFDVLTHGQKKEYEQAKSHEMARQVGAIKSKEWAKMNRSQKTKAINKMKMHYKFDKNSRTYVKRERPLTLSGNLVNLKSAFGNIFRMGKGLFKGAGYMAKLLNNISAEAGALQGETDPNKVKKVPLK
jgi:hypothetical protein